MTLTCTTFDRHCTQAMEDESLLSIIRNADQVVLVSQLAVKAEADKTLPLKAAETSAAKAVENQPEYLDVSQLAVLMGMKVGTIYTWRSKSPEKLPPAINLGTLANPVVRYSLTEVIDFMKRRSE